MTYVRFYAGKKEADMATITISDGTEVFCKG
jgi:hypothetical protein